MLPKTTVCIYIPREYAVVTWRESPGDFVTGSQLSEHKIIGMINIIDNLSKGFQTFIHKHLCNHSADNLVSFPDSNLVFHRIRHGKTKN